MDNNKVNHNIERFCESLFSTVRIQNHTTVRTEAADHKEKIKQKVFNKISFFEGVQNIPLENRANSKKLKQYKLISYVSAAASVTIICLLTTLFIMFTNNNVHNANITNIEVKTPHGAKSSFTLPDGTLVMLNSNSKLIYPSLFTETNKKIILDGEAYFKVTPQKHSPLIISTKNLNTHVLGTELNIKAYSSEETHQLTLIKGKVFGEVVHADESMERIELQPDQQLLLTSESREFARRNVISKDYALWTQGYIVFRDASLKEIAAQLTREFNQELFITDDCAALNDKYVATFDTSQHTLEEILNILSYKRGWRYIKDKNKYIITLK